jgi:hypothetical protein
MADFSTRLLQALDLDTIFGSEHARPPAWHKFRLFFSKLAADLNAHLGVAPQSITCAADHALVVNNPAVNQSEMSSFVLLVDPGGAGRNFTLADALPQGVYTIMNTADAAETLTVKNSAGTTISAIAQNKSAVIVHVATSTWRGGVLQAS